MVLPLVTGSSAFSQTDLFAISGDQVTQVSDLELAIKFIA